MLLFPLTFIYIQILITQTNPLAKKPPKKPLYT